MALPAFRSTSANKEVARAKSYDAIGKDIYKGYNLVIASQECGDIKYLLWNKNIQANRIIACDVDPVAVEKAKSFKYNRYSIVTSNNSIQDTLYWALERRPDMKLPIVSVNVDLCMSLPKALPILNEVMLWLKIYQCPARLMLTFYAARDTELITGTTLERREERRYQEIVKANGGIKPALYHRYQSVTPGKPGSPMVAVVF